MSADGASLLNFLDAPVVVGDPEGRVIFANPAFEECFALGAQAAGTPFVELFQGGGREAFLMAVAQVCDTGETVRFRLREEGRGYLGVASPIEAEDDRVGVMILLSDEPFSMSRLSVLQRDIEEPLEELCGLLDELVERSSAAAESDIAELASSALQAAERAHKSSSDLQSLVTRQTSPASSELRLDPVKTVRAVEHRVREECEQAGLRLELLVPDALPAAVGDGEHLETVLLRMLRDRIEQCDAGDCVTLAVRRVTLGSQECAAFSLVAPCRSDSVASLRRVRDSIAALGGFRHACVHAAVGRATVIPFPLDV